MSTPALGCTNITFNILIVNKAKPIYTLIFSIFIVALGLIPQHLRATHVAGGDISYQCLGGNQYQIKLRLYRDCQAIA